MKKQLFDTNKLSSITVNTLSPNSISRLTCKQIDCMSTKDIIKIDEELLKNFSVEQWNHVNQDALKKLDINLLKYLLEIHSNQTDSVIINKTHSDKTEYPVMVEGLYHRLLRAIDSRYKLNIEKKEEILRKKADISHLSGWDYVFLKVARDKLGFHSVTMRNIYKKHFRYDLYKKTFDYSQNLGVYHLVDSKAQNLFVKVEDVIKFANDARVYYGSDSLPELNYIPELYTLSDIASMYNVDYNSARIFKWYIINKIKDGYLVAYQFNSANTFLLEITPELLSLIALF